MKNGICPKCNAHRVIGDVRVIDLSNNGVNDFSVALYKNPDALLFKGEHRNVLNSYICRNCGYAELYVADLERFNEDYDKIMGE